MRIIYLANVRLPTEKAHGIQIMKMCEAFALKGAEVELIVPWRFNKIKGDPFESYRVKRIFKIKKIPSLDLIPLAVPWLGFWVQNLTFAFFANLYLFFKTIDLIYSRDFLSLFPLVFFRQKIVCESHFFPKHFWLYRSLIKRIKALVVITQKLKELYQAKGIEPKKILVAPDGVDLRHFQIRESQEECRQKLNLAQDKKIVLYTGHLYQWKGTQVLAEAARFLSNDYLVVFVGGTEKEIRDFKWQVSGSGNILVVGHRPYLEMPYWLKAADVLVLPNSAKTDISKYWTSPMKMFEYMAAGKPIVASDLPSIREILNENNALLIEPDNAPDLAKGIKGALGNEAIGRRAKQDVLSYTWQKRTKHILTFIQEQ